MVKISNARIDMEGARVDQPVFKKHGETLGGGTGVPVATTASYTVNLNNGTVFNLQLNAATVTFTFSNPTASGTACSFTLILEQDSTGGRLASWPTSVVWPSGTAPTLTTTASMCDVLNFYTTNGGTTWYGVAAMQNIPASNSGQLWAWGAGTSGVLGDNTIIAKSVPITIAADKTWASVAKGVTFTAAVSTTGALWTWGGNGTGTIGDNTAVARSSPVAIATDKTWAKVQGGKYHTAAITTTGALWMWGLDTSGQLGDNGTIVNKSSPVAIATDKTWASVAAGGTHTASITTTGALWAWGRNATTGPLGDNTIINKSSPVAIATDKTWASVAAGVTHTAAITTTGALWTWGGNSTGQLGDNTTVAKSSPVAIATDKTWASVAAGYTHTAALTTAGALWGWGANGSYQLAVILDTLSASSPIAIAAGRSWASVSAGTDHNAAVTTTGALWAWGNNSSGQLGNGAGGNYQSSHSSPVQVGTATNWSQALSFNNTYVAAFTTTAGGLWMWGDSSSGQLGDNTTIRVRNSPAQAASDKVWASAAITNSVTAAITTAGALWVWGRTDQGQTGDSTVTQKSSPVAVATDKTWASVALGQDHVLAIQATTGALWGWGKNTNNMLGDNTAISKSSPVALATDKTWAMASGSRYFSEAITTVGALWAWGQNTGGKLGDRTVTSRSSPVAIATDKTWAVVAAGYTHTAAITTAGQLWAWGVNTSGMLGDNTVIAKSSPIQIATDKTWATALGSLAVTQLNTIAITNTGQLWAWGDNTTASSGILGDNSGISKSSPVQIATDKTWSSVGGSRRHVAAVTTAGTAWVWGSNAHGEQADGYRVGTKIVTPISIATDKSWLAVSAGVSTTIAVGKAN